MKFNVKSNFCLKVTVVNKRKWSVTAFFTFWCTSICHPSSCPAGHLRSFTPPITVSRIRCCLHGRHPTFFRSLSTLLLQVVCGLPGFVCLLVSRSLQFWRCYCRLSAGCVQPISISVFLSSQTVSACRSACTVPHLRFGLAKNFSVSFSCISCEKHPRCSCLQL